MVTCRLGELDFGIRFKHLVGLTADFMAKYPLGENLAKLNKVELKPQKKTITEEALQKCSLSLNKKGSVLVAMYGANIGESEYWTLTQQQTKLFVHAKPIAV